MEGSVITHWLLAPLVLQTEILRSDSLRKIQINTVQFQQTIGLCSPYKASRYSASLLDGSMYFNSRSSPLEYGGLLAGVDQHPVGDDGVVLLLALGY